MGPRDNIDTSSLSRMSSESLNIAIDSNSSRGRKRSHADTECTDSCDCDEFGLPLAKKINRMNIEQNGQQKIEVKSDGDIKMSLPASAQSSSSSDSQQQSPNNPEFCHKYPFPSDSPYYQNNLLLSKLYSERVNRHPHLKHDPN